VGGRGGRKSEGGGKYTRAPVMDSRPVLHSLSDLVARVTIDIDMRQGSPGDAAGIEAERS